MPTNWTNNNSVIQGDLVITLEKGRVYTDYVEIFVYAYSNKITRFDIAFEYRLNPLSNWLTNAVINTNTDYSKNNKIYGLLASNSGYVNKITWKYKDNYLLNSDNPEVRVRILPSIKQLSKYNTLYILSEAYGDNKVDFITKSNQYKVIGINNYGQYICAENNQIHILNSMDSSPSYSYSGTNSPLYAIQKYDDKYIVADTVNSRIIELDSEFLGILETYSVDSPQFIDYSEENETLLITSRDTDAIYEISWSSGTVGTLYWTSGITLSDPSCATYSKNNVNKIIISDTGNNRIIIYDKDSDNYTIRTECTFRLDYTSNDQIIELYKPFRAYQLYDDQICIVEEIGKPLFFDLDSSSSSSSSEGDSSSSSEIYSSSSSSDDDSSSSSSDDDSSSSSSESMTGIGVMIIGSTFIIG